MIVLLIPIVLAVSPSYTYKQNTIVDLKFFCFNENNTYCLSNTKCNITILYPDSTLLVSDGNMTYNNNYFNYTLTSTQTSILGEYAITVLCYNSNNASFSTYTFEILQSGFSRGNFPLGIIIGAIGIAILFSYISSLFNTEKKILKTLFISISLFFTVVIIQMIKVMVNEANPTNAFSKLIDIMLTSSITILVIFITWLFIIMTVDLINWLKRTFNIKETKLEEEE